MTVLHSMGAYVPSQKVHNSDLAKKIGRSADWIEQRTGIRTRHYASENETAAMMSVAAARIALERGDICPTDIDTIIVATVSPDRCSPSNACMVQKALGCTRAVAFDVSAGCSGFLFALNVAEAFFETKRSQTALIIGGERPTSFIDFGDPATSCVFADGAGAAVLKSDGESNVSSKAMDIAIYSDGRYSEHIYVDGGPGSTGTVGKVRMDGSKVFRRAVQNMSTAAEEVLLRNNVALSDINWIIPHQANLRIIEAIARRLDIPKNKFVVTLDTHGNTSSASIPLALECAIKSGKIRRGDKLLLPAFGSGLTWGCGYLEY